MSDIQYHWFLNDGNLTIPYSIVKIVQTIKFYTHQEEPKIDFYTILDDHKLALKSELIINSANDVVYNYSKHVFPYRDLNPVDWKLLNKLNAFAAIGIIDKDHIVVIQGTINTDTKQATIEKHWDSVRYPVTLLDSFVNQQLYKIGFKM